jgi:hypothetical protein
VQPATLIAVKRSGKPNLRGDFMLFLRNQLLDLNDLNLEMQEAVYDVWLVYGFDAARVFCQGA